MMDTEIQRSAVQTGALTTSPRTVRHRSTGRWRGSFTTSVLMAVMAASMLSACDTTTTAEPELEPEPPPASPSSDSHNSTPVTIVWNREARTLVKQYSTGAAPAMRVYALVSVAQYNALVAAENSKEPRKHPSVAAAVAGASAAMLSYLYPNEAPQLNQKVAQMKQETPAQGPVDFASGEAIGRGIAAGLITRAQQDGFFKPFTGTVPVCEGCWVANPSPPAFATLGGAKTFLLVSGDQFRPAAPPAFGSPAFVADLAEVRTISDNRTTAQDSIAKFWSLQGGTVTPLGHWNIVADSLARRYRMNERRTALTFALMNIAGHDGLIASHDAKYTYWLIRPTQADAQITLPIALPSFPSYPSNHALISAAAAVVLGDFFPAHRQALMAQAEEAAVSRVYGGIHFRFDATVGISMGKEIAQFVLAEAPSGVRPIVIR